MNVRSDLGHGLEVTNFSHIIGPEDRLELQLTVAFTCSIFGVIINRLR